MRIQNLSEKIGVACTLMLLLSSLASADIVFTSDRDGQIDIYVMKDDGSHVRRLTNSPLYQSGAVWSPDGKYIAFKVNLHSGTPGREPQYDIFIMTANGEHQQNLTQHPALDSNMSWSPDGRHLAFTSNRSGGWEIHVMDIATREVWQLTHSGADGYASAPAWSPDGRHIAYEFAMRAQGRHVYIMGADGRNVHPLVKAGLPGVVGHTSILRFSVHWSPDGEHLLYNEMTFSGKGGRIANDLVIRRRDGRHPRILDIPSVWQIDAVCWAADGRAVLFAAVPNRLRDKNRPETFKIYRYSLASGQITNLTNHPSDNWFPDWTPHAWAVSSAGKLTTQWARIKAKSVTRESF